MKTKIKNVSDAPKRLWLQGKTLILDPGKVEIVNGKVAGNIRDHYAFEVEEVSDEEKPKRNKKVKGEL